MSQPDGGLTGRCYCGRVTLQSDEAPTKVVYCHCDDCRRWTGGPVGVFAGIERGSLILSPAFAPFKPKAGVDRWSCPDCGSPLAAWFDYIPDLLWVPIGVLDAPDLYPPMMHSHAAEQLPWLHISDDLPRDAASGRDRINDV